MGFTTRSLGRSTLLLLLMFGPLACSKSVKEAEVPPTPAIEKQADPASPFTVTLEFGEHYLPGTTNKVHVAMNYTGAEPVTALALQTKLPQAWQYAGISGNVRPAIDPPKGTTEQVTLIWIQIPEFPASVEYMLEVPTWAEGTYTLSTQAIYRTLGGELKSPTSQVSVTASKPQATP